VEVLVRDALEPCPYLPGQQARLPLRWQLRPVTGEAFDEALAIGDRRVGGALYRPTCPGCRACETIRIPVAEFTPSRTQRRVWRQGLASLVVQIGRPTCTARHLELFNRHKSERGLARRDSPTGPRGYRGWLVETCTESVEIRYLCGGALAGVAIMDVGARAASAVYTCWDPDRARLSPGTFSVLWQIEWARRTGLAHLYLGLHVVGNAHMAYKAAFLPHERREAGEPAPPWRRYDRLTAG
jgi:arginine-tRNA-protein transferase